MLLNVFCILLVCSLKVEVVLRLVFVIFLVCVFDVCVVVMMDGRKVMVVFRFMLDEISVLSVVIVGLKLL